MVIAENEDFICEETSFQHLINILLFTGLKTYSIYSFWNEC